MFCGNCGKEIDDNASVCKWCGTSVGEEPEIRETKTVKEQSAISISLGLLGAGVYWLGIVNVLVAFLLIGYILLKEKDVWLKAVAVKAAALIVAFNLIEGMLYILQNFLDSFNSFLSLIGTVPLGQSGLYQLCVMLIGICGIVLNILLLLCGYKALHYKNLKLGFLDRLVSKNLNR